MSGTRSALQPGWTEEEGASLFAFVTSGSRGWAKYYSDQGPLFLRIGNLNRGSISLDLQDIQRVAPPKGAEGLRTRVAPNDILVSITADLGLVAVIPNGCGEAYINQHVALARPQSDVNSKYVAWFIASPEGQDQLSALQRGATKKGLGLDDIRSLRVPMAPPDAQNQIVAEIEKQFTRLDAGVEALKRLQAHLRRYRAAVLKAACEGAYASPSSRGEWVVVPFDAALEVVSDHGKRVAQAEYMPEGELAVVDQGEMLVGGFTNDVSMQYVGPLPILVFGDHTRRFKYVDFPFAVGAQGVKLLRPKGDATHKFLFYALSSAKFEDRGYSRHFQFLKKTDLLIPPREAQEAAVAEIESRMSVLDSAVRATSEALQRSGRLRAAILRAAFDGHLI